MIFDPMYLIVVGPAILLALWAQGMVKSAFGKMSRVAVRSGVTGAQAAAQILQRHGLNHVGIELAQGMLSDHYDPRHKVLRLSPDVYHGRSIAAVGVAAHEAGHALQDDSGYAPLKLRNGIVPLASVGSNLSWVLVMLGLFMSFSGLIWAGIILFSAVVVFQLINLPVEFNASRRAREVLMQTGIVSGQEDAAVGKVLNAAAMTYVAATLTAVLTLIYYLLRAQGSRN
ncbi:MAG: hypothetical protein HJJLKODD_02359 [Phycisphaerae bacterium]|nr:hypothetical protein [Phycisphaerae bacterium]